MAKEISQCRICGNSNLVPLLNLGSQYLTGIFPTSPEAPINSGPLELVMCSTENGCNLVQLKHSYDKEEMYGEGYGYRSGLNNSMVKHLFSIVDEIAENISLSGDDLIVDIGSNDSTLLQRYQDHSLTLLGIDPTGKKFIKYYPEHIQLIPDFFSSKLLKKEYPGKKAKVITSIAMFYDLEEPQLFVNEVADSLTDDGVWIFEQSYLGLMLETNSYDTICHEHVVYYGLKQIQWLLDRAGLHILDVVLNDINGGSFRIVASKKKRDWNNGSKRVQQLVGNEEENNLYSIETYEKFSNNINKHRSNLLTFLNDIKNSGKKIVGYGASTKGNVILQYCNINKDLLPCIAEVNTDKFGCVTPGTNIPIISEEEARKMKPDYFLVLPWHFKENILEREAKTIDWDCSFVFPLPKIEIIPM